MGTLKIEAGKYYRTRDGRKAYVAGICPFDGINAELAACGFVQGQSYVTGTQWCVDGCFYANGAHYPSDLVAEWVEPKRIKGWVAFCKSGIGFGNVKSTKEEAIDSFNSFGYKAPAACIEIDVLEGEGL